MLESNINIVSNIYIRSNENITKDYEYIRHITGVKLLKYIKNNYSGFQSIRMTEVQEKIVKETDCPYAKNKEISFGPIMKDGSLVWACHCEYTPCFNHSKCMELSDSLPIQRENKPVLPPEKDDLDDFLKQLGITFDGENLQFERKHIIIEDTPEKVYVKKFKEPEITENISDKYEIIKETDCIINSPIDSHIILNSGPGTGKTYTIIQRLIYILMHSLCPAEQIYILCYTRSAKKLIEYKIDDAVRTGLIPASAKNICILTFDSYASYFLMALQEQDEIKVNFTDCSYNDRIKLFNKYISEEDFEDVGYFIVDEIQDLVNDRAEMVLNILKHLKCGYLLAGDRCQSIYDYEADDDATLDSVEFYRRAEKQFPDDMLRYEISVNRRQSIALAEYSSDMRDVLLHKGIREQNIHAKQIMMKFAENIKIETYIKNLQHSPSVSTAILCRSNGEAEYISGLLCEKKLPHILNRGVNNTVSLPKWIADIFWDYCHETISKDDFMERFCFRCNSKINSEKIWGILCRLADSDDMITLSVIKLISALAETNNIPNELYEESPLLTVSTIHKAKGSEFDRVILVDSDIEESSTSAEEARIRYVALTRPKNQLITMKKNRTYFRRTMSGRVIRTNIHSPYKRLKKYCSNIVVGLTGDVNCCSFVSGEFDNALALQEYITNNINLYDELSVIRSQSNERLEIMHKEHCIGTLSRSMLDEIKMGIDATDYSYNLPDTLTNVYVSGITTEILKRFDSSVPVEFQKSKICYGIQITGLAKLNFEKR